MKNLFYALFIALLLASCSSKEEVIDESVEKYDLLLSSAQPKLAHYTMPGMSVQSADIYKDSLKGAIKIIKEFRDSFYIVIPELKRIDVVDKWSLVKTNTIDFASLNLAPYDIDFANASQAFVVHTDSNSVSLVDLTNFKIIKQIPVGEKPVAIKAIGNQIFVANQSSSTVSIIDSRNNDVVSTIPVNTAPTFVGAKNDGSEAIIISLGDGKLNANAKTEPSATFINVVSRATTVVNTFYPGTLSTQAKEINVNSFTACANSYIFLATDKGLLRMDTKKKDKFSQSTKNVYSQIFYNVRLNKLFAFSNTIGFQKLDLVSAAAQQTIKPTETIDFIYAY